MGKRSRESRDSDDDDDRGSKRMSGVFRGDYAEYTKWCYRFEALLRKKKCASFLTKKKCPPKPVKKITEDVLQRYKSRKSDTEWEAMGNNEATRKAALKAEVKDAVKKMKKERKEWRQKQKLIWDLLVQYTDDEAFTIVTNCKSGFGWEAWEALDMQYCEADEGDIQLLTTRLASGSAFGPDQMGMLPGDSVKAYITAMNALHSELYYKLKPSQRKTWPELQEKSRLRVLKKCLSADYLPVISNTLTLMPKASYAVVCKALISHENLLKMRSEIRGEHPTATKQSNRMLGGVASGSNSDHNVLFLKGSAQDWYDAGAAPSKAVLASVDAAKARLRKMLCWVCGKYGHFSRSCPDPSAADCHRTGNFPHRPVKKNGNGNGGKKNQKALAAKPNNRGTKRLKTQNQRQEKLINVLLTKLANGGNGDDDSVSSSTVNTTPDISAYVKSGQNTDAVAGWLGVPKSILVAPRVLSDLARNALVSLKLRAKNTWVADSGAGAWCSWDEGDFVPGTLKPASGESVEMGGGEIHKLLWSAGSEFNLFQTMRMHQ